jgi:hypothetical protein
MNNSYADIDTNLSEMLHGAARLHVHLGRMSNVNIMTRGWTYNDLVDGILGLSSDSPDKDYQMVKQYRSIDCLFDTLDAITEIGARAVTYLSELRKMANN